jgi:hypothetical protein
MPCAVVADGAGAGGAGWQVNKIMDGVMVVFSVTKIFVSDQCM